MEEDILKFCEYLEDHEGIEVPEKDDLISRFIRFCKPDEIRPIDIKKCVSIVTKVKVEDLSLVTRKRSVVEARQFCMYFMCEYTRLSLATIGMEFESNGHIFDHATVMHAKKTVTNLAETDRVYNEKFAEIQGRIEALK